MCVVCLCFISEWFFVVVVCSFSCQFQLFHLIFPCVSVFCMRNKMCTIYKFCLIFHQRAKWWTFINCNCCCCKKQMKFNLLRCAHIIWPIRHTYLKYSWSRENWNKIYTLRNNLKSALITEHIVNMKSIESYCTEFQIVCFCFSLIEIQESCN